MNIYLINYYKSFHNLSDSLHEETFDQYLAWNCAMQELEEMEDQCTLMHERTAIITTLEILPL